MNIINKDKLKTESVYFTIIPIAKKTIGFLLIPIIANSLGAEKYGVFGYLIVLSGLTASAMEMGLSAGLVRFFFETKHKDRFVYQIYVLIFGFLIAITFIILISKLILIHFNIELVIMQYVWFILLMGSLTVFSKTSEQIFILNQKAKFYLLYSIIYIILLFTLTLILIHYFNNKINAPLISYPISLLIFLVICFLYILKRYRFPKIKDLIHTIKNSKFILLFSIPLFFHTAIQWVLSSSDRVILERFISLSDLGIYNFAYSVGILVLFLFQGVNKAWSPFAIEKGLNRSKSDLLQLNKSAHILMIVNYCIFSTVIFLGPIAVNLVMREEYLACIPIIPYIALGGFFLNFYTIPTTGVSVMKKTKYIPLVTLVAGFTSISLNLILVPKFGIYAAAVVTTISYFILLLLYIIFDIKIKSNLFKYKSLLKYFVFSIITTGICLVILNSAIYDNMFLIIACYFMNMLLCWFVLINRKERNFFMNLLVEIIKHISFKKSKTKK